MKRNTNTETRRNHTVGDNETTKLSCCRCGCDVTITGAELDRYNRESKVLLCTGCEKS